MEIMKEPWHPAPVSANLMMIQAAKNGGWNSPVWFI